MTIGGKTAGSAANFVLASASDSTAANLVGLLDLRGHVATVTAGDIIMGRRSGNGGNGATGTISFDSGTFTVNNLSMGIRQQDAAGTGGKATGILNVAGGVFTVNAGGSVILGTRLGTTGTGTAEGIINLSGGTLVSNVDIQHGGGTGAVSTINMTGGIFDLKGRNFGDAVNRITTLNFKNGRLQNVGEVNGGQTGLTITGTTGDIVVLEGVNTYTGGTSLTSGARLQVGSGGITGVLGSGQVTMANAATVAFNRSNAMTVNNVFAGAGGNLEQMGTGRTILTATSTHTGTTTVKAGVLQATSATVLSQSTRLVVESGGAFYFLSGSGGSMNLAQGASQNLDLRDGSIVGVEVGGTINSGAVGALTAGNVELRLFGNPSLGSLPGNTPLLQSSGGGLNGANYSLRVYNNTNFGATLNAKTDTAITAAITGATALTQAWWVGGRVTGNTGEWAVSTGATSNWGADAAGATTAVVPGATTDVFISATGGDATSMSLGADMSVGSITVQSTGAANLTDARYLLTLTKSNAITTNAGAGATNLAVRLNLANAAPIITVNSTTALTLSGVLTGSAGFNKSGAGTLILSGAEANEYTGAVSVTAGTVELSKTAGQNAITGNLAAGDGTGSDRVLWRASDQIADSSIVTLNVGGLLSLNGFSDTIGGLNGVGTVENASGSVASVLAVGFGGASSSFEGLLRNGSTGTLGLTKTGAGT
ncbi:beta strand repeat-containing protein [Verrucomicrobium spinosum]|uniref:beta strand repeat-containing protein n=1 Tax=Verrucomicrobium spinosum TaxID=2736 RepID=UPI0009468319|nr:autotransporter-associated beta strand repeat-containing protein [Verrucomicrobium spinosum]